MRTYRKPAEIKERLKYATRYEQDCLSLIWQRCGKTPFIWKYLKEHAEISTNPTKLRADGYIVPAGWIKAWGKPVRIWQLSDKIARRLEATYEPPSDDVLKSCENSIVEFTESFNEKRKEKRKERNLKSAQRR